MDISNKKFERFSVNLSYSKPLDLEIMNEFISAENNGVKPTQYVRNLYEKCRDLESQIAVLKKTSYSQEQLAQIVNILIGQRQPAGNAMPIMPMMAPQFTAQNPENPNVSEKSEEQQVQVPVRRKRRATQKTTASPVIEEEEQVQTESVEEEEEDIDFDHDEELFDDEDVPFKKGSSKNAFRLGKSIF